MKTLKPVSWEARTLLEYWDAIRGTRLVPSRRDISPAAIPKLLPNVFMTEVRGPRDLRLRLVGTAHRDRLGRETTGSDALEELPEIYRESRAYMFWQVVNRPCAYYGTGLMDSVSANIPHEVLILPLSSAIEGDPMMLLGIMMPLGGQRWGDVSDPMLENVASERLLDIGAGIPPLHPWEGWDKVGPSSQSGPVISLAR